MTDVPGPILDASALQYPSDIITLEQMRNDDPALMTIASLASLSASSIDAVATHYWEQVVAERALNDALDRPPPSQRLNHTEVVEMLDNAYQKYGISSGRQQSMILIRDLEAQAARQAGRLIDRPR